jgi:thiol-disulfide isomerase/thioredoxin
MNKNLFIGGGIAAVLLLAFVFAFSGGDATTDGFAFGDVTVDGQALPQLEAGANDPALGQPGPVISGFDDAGNPITVGGPGEPRIVMFLAHWCSHCQREVPTVTDYLANNDVSVQFQSVATGSNPTAPNYPPSDWLEAEDWPVATLYDDQSNTAGTAYGLSAFPFWVVLDADGAVQARFSGELDDVQLASVIEFAGTLAG